MPRPLHAGDAAWTAHAEGFRARNPQTGSSLGGRTRKRPFQVRVGSAATRSTEPWAGAGRPVRRAGRARPGPLQALRGLRAGVARVVGVCAASSEFARRHRSLRGVVGVCAASSQFARPPRNGVVPRRPRRVEAAGSAALCSGRHDDVHHTQSRLHHARSCPRHTRSWLHHAHSRPLTAKSVAPESAPTPPTSRPPPPPPTRTCRRRQDGRGAAVVRVAPGRPGPGSNSEVVPRRDLPLAARPGSEATPWLRRILAHGRDHGLPDRPAFAPSSTPRRVAPSRSESLRRRIGPGPMGPSESQL